LIKDLDAIRFPRLSQQWAKAIMVEKKKRGGVRFSGTHGKK
jgi:hypothetical protein